MKKENKIAIVATSPLQIMLAHEISKKYNPKYVKCYIMTFDGDNRYHKCEKLAKDYGYEVEASYIDYGSHRWKVIKNSLSSLISNRGFDIVIQGIFANSFYYSLSIKLLKNGGNLLITDDGTATFQLEDSKYMNSFINSYVFKGLYALMSLRKIKHNIFYSIFDNIKTTYFDMEKLCLNQIKSDKEPTGVYFLGTYQEAYTSKFIPQMSNVDYQNLIAQTVQYIRRFFPSDEIFYTPHGREQKSTSLNICKKWDLQYLPSSVSVEVDYPQNGVNPKVIIGFRSTALFTLKAIYPNAEVIDIQPLNFKFIYPDALIKNDQTEDKVGISRVILEF